MLKSSVRGAMAPFIVMEVVEAAARLERAGRSVLHLEVGQPSTGAPEPVLRAAEHALRSDLIGYTTAKGIPALREKIAQSYLRRYGVDIDIERIIVTPGSSGAFLLSFLAAFDHGSRVALAAPSYPCYRNILGALDVEVAQVPCGPETRYELTPQVLDTLGELDGVIVASPSNPTGSIIHEPEMRALVDWCAANRVRLISDEIYHGLEYGDPAVSATTFSDKAIVINSFSKYYSMTGWRLGWMVAPEDLLRPVEKAMQNFFISAPTLSQHAAVAAFDAEDELQGHIRRYAENRQILLDAMPGLGITQTAPADGAFYVYADVSHLTSDSRAFCAEILEKTGVAVTPGVDFDPLRGDHTLRLSYAGSTAHMVEAMDRLTNFVRTR